MTKFPTTYRVSVYTCRATYLSRDMEFSRKTEAVRTFNNWASDFINERDATVLLSRNGTTMAAKSTDSNEVVFHHAFYA